jgi:hypothetical protein
MFNHIPSAVDTGITADDGTAGNVRDTNCVTLAVASEKVFTHERTPEESRRETA